MPEWMMPDAHYYAEREMGMEFLDSDEKEERVRIVLAMINLGRICLVPNEGQGR